MSQNHWQDWQPVRLYGQGIQPRTGRFWDCDPAWDVTAVYAGPDATVAHPHYYMAQRGDPGELPGKEKTKALFRNRHIDRRFHIEYPRASKESPRTQSWTIGDTDREWDVLVERRNAILSAAGLRVGDDARAMARALAEYWKHEVFRERPHATTFATENRHLNNPIEGLLHQSHCAGAAAAYAALADSCGLTVRTIGCGGHIIAEVMVDGRWRCVDSAGRHEKSRDFPRYFDSDYLDLTLAPMGAHADAYPDERRAGPWRRPNPQFHFQRGMWQSPVTERFCTQCAFACYPYRKDWGIVSDDGRRLPILDRAKGFYWPTAHFSDNALVQEVRRASFPAPMADLDYRRDHLYHAFRPGQKLRTSIWLDQLDDVQEMELGIPLAASRDSDFSEAAGRQMKLRVGDFERSLADLGAWPGQAEGANCVSRIKLPASIFRPCAVNWIELTHAGRSLYHAAMVPSALQPYIPPLWGETGEEWNPPRA